ncbi:glycosyl hydrolase [Catalinimonas sp. 4WD22]|uniref:WD40/YVTN/BNR-like repeat-containing protein n=1 Tax=Catalinimonas locisalis TaxID=3133978 RepID=UPI0031018848
MMKTLLSSLLCLSLFFGINPAYTQSEQANSNSAYFSAMKFRNVGPTRGGRVTAVAGVASKPGTFYMGSTGGGVWKTEDYGITYENLSDGYFASPSIGAISVYQNNPDIIYVGTGSDGLRSNIISGKGMYKSTDAGKSWDFLGLEDAGLIGAVEIHPQHPDTAFVAAIGQPFQPNEQRGVFRTYDGGKSWEKVFYHSDTVGAVDLEFAPDNPQTIYAALWRAERKPWTIISGGANESGGIYKSTDGGDSWSRLENGLPQGLIGKIDLAVSPADPNRLYALVEAPLVDTPGASTPGKGGGLYRSDDRGETFEFISNHDGLLDRPFYYCNIAANPLDADVLFAMATQFFKSTDGGKSWKTMSTPHGDNHDIWINPNDTSLFIQANDGGVNVTTNGGKTWSTQSNQPTAELYQIEVDDQHPYWVYAGQQDNTTIAVPSLPPYDAPAGGPGFWLAVGGCETGPAVPKPGNPNIVYSNCKGRFGVFDKRTGQEQQYYVGAAYIYGHNPENLEYRFQRVSPIHVSPHNPDVVYHGSQYVHKTTDDGKTWERISPDLTANDPATQVISGSPITRDVTGEEYYSTIYSIRESPLEEGVIWVGANDGPVHVTKDGGKTWENVTPNDLPDGGRVDSVEPSPHQPGKAYFSVLLYQLGDWKPYIYKTEDYGASWTLLTDGTNGIPADYPTRVVREDPVKEGLLYAGTEYGLFVSLNDGESWQPFQQNLPITPVTDIKVFRNDLLLSTMGRSFWILDNITPLHQLANAKEAASAYLYQPEDAYRYRYRDTDKDEIPYYPEPSVIIDYFLKNSSEGEVKLDILNAKQQLIRSFSSSDTQDTTQEEMVDMATGFYKGETSDALKSSAGSHRFRWNMQYPGPWDQNPKRSYQRGPMVSPGTYTARLTVDGKTYTQSFEVLADPRLKYQNVSEEDINAQIQLVMNIIGLEDSTKLTAAKIKERREELAKLMEENGASNKYKKEDQKLAQIQDQLVTSEGIYMRPMLIDQLSYLRSMLEQADQRPGSDAYQRYEELKAQWNDLQDELNSFELEGLPRSSDD